MTSTIRHWSAWVLETSPTTAKESNICLKLSGLIVHSNRLLNFEHQLKHLAIH